MYQNSQSHGQTFPDVYADVYGDEEFEGKVSLVYPTIDATTHTFPVEVKLANTHQRIRQMCIRDRGYSDGHGA